MSRKKQWVEWLWDAWCVVSVLGIWPRYIEPRLLVTTRLNLPISSLPSELEDLRILHFSDLHWSTQFSSLLLAQLNRKVKAFKPDLILFTGDFLCRSQLENQQGLKNMLIGLKATMGCFAVLGNHDYSEFVTVNANGDYDIDPCFHNSTIAKGFKRLFQSSPLTKKITAQAQQTQLNTDLMALLKQTSFHLLHNTTQLLAYKNSYINICGLGEYTLGKFKPEEAFKNYNKNYPGIILSHNPDTFKILESYPGDIILAGHTHGGQVNLPGLWKRLTRIENLNFKRGLKRIGKKWAYVNRGISSIMKFRWFSIPELTLITLQKG